LNQDGSPKEYVLSSGECHSVREFVEKAFKAAGIKGFWEGEKESERYIMSSVRHHGKKVDLVTINPKFYRPFEVTKLHGSHEKIKKELGWEPKVSFEELVKKMVDNDIKLINS